MATSEAAVIGRAKTVLEDLGFTEAPTLDFSKLPAGAHSGRFTLLFRGDTPQGQIGWQEEMRGALLISLTQSIDEDYDAARTAALTAGRQIVNALARDGAETSGEYAVEDTGRAVEIVSAPGAAFLECRLRVPVNFEVTL